MNKNGFTLVELLAVIVLLGLVLVLTMTNGLGLFNKAKGGINQIEEDNLFEAAKVFLVDVDNDFVEDYPSTCPAKTNFVDVMCGVSVKYLEDNNYFDDKGNDCKDDAYLNLMIKIDGENREYIVEKVVDDIICSN